MAQHLLLAIIAVAALLPFERLGGFSLTGFHLRLSQVALLVAWFLFAREWLLGRRSLEWRRGTVLALAAFFAAAGLSLLNAENLKHSLLVLGFTMFTSSLALLVPNILKNEKDFTRVRLAILVSAALVSLFGLWQFVGDMLGLPASMTGIRDTYSRAILGFTRVQATAAEPLYFANYLLLPIALSGAWLLRTVESKIQRWLSILLAVMCANVFLTSSRGGWLGCAVTISVLLWLERGRLRDWQPLARSAAIAGASLVLGALLLGSFFSSTRETVTQRFFGHVTTITDGAAYDERAQTIKAAIEAWRLRPWMGIGFGGYGPFVSTFVFTEPDSGWPIVNNETLELLAETGLIGLGAFIAFLIVLFREVARRQENGEIESIRIACLAALIGMLVQYQTFSTLYIMHVWFTISLLIASSMRIDRTR